MENLTTDTDDEPQEAINSDMVKNTYYRLRRFHRKFATSLPTDVMYEPCTAIPVSDVTGMLYMGGIESLKSINKYGIEVVFSITPTYQLPSDILQYNYCIDDSSDLETREKMQTMLQSAVDLLYLHLASGNKVLVHCQAGISRSATLIAAYFVKHQKMTFADSLIHLKQIRKCAFPNSGFLRVLHDYWRANT